MIPVVHGMLPTPFTAAGDSVDHPSLASLVSTVAARGCTSLIALGVIAEPAALSMKEKLAVLETIADTAGDGIGLTASVMHGPDRADEARTFCRRLRESISSIMVPVSSSDPLCLRAELAAVHDATDLPLIIQDYPAASGVTITVDDLVRAMEGLPYVTAVKCEAAPTFWRMRQLADRTAVTIIAGMGGIALADELSSGASEIACGTSRPEIIVEAARSWSMGAHAEARSIISSASSLIVFETQQTTSVAIRKEHWRRQGVIAHSTVRPPSIPYQPEFSSLSDAHGQADSTASCALTAQPDAKRSPVGVGTGRAR